MNPQDVKNTIQVIAEALTPLAEKIGQGSEHLFELAIKLMLASPKSKPELKKKD